MVFSNFSKSVIACSRACLKLIDSILAAARNAGYSTGFQMLAQLVENSFGYRPVISFGFLSFCDLSPVSVILADC